ncbi:MAG TPA: hypothetical protein VJ997_08875 [Longimicrobiales bacterium]|nr:hypothetical protein [Longimicrobiales bacterium]
MTTRRRSTDQGGFALAMVVLLLFAIAVAGVAGFQVVDGEFAMATQNRDSQEALIVARGGLQRFLGETVGQVGDSVSYAIGNGIATVTTRRVFRKDSLNSMYYIRSEGSVADVRTPLVPTRRVVGTYAWHRLNPIPLTAAVLLTGGANTVYYTTVSGADHATTANCPGGGTTGVIGLGTAGTVYVYPPSYGFGGSVVGGSGKSATKTYSSFDQAYNAVGLRWDILKDPAFPVDFEGMMPDFSTLPADSFPIVRFNGNFSTGGSYQSGRGVLIVTGTLDLLWNFRWDGIILAGAVTSTSGSTTVYPTVNGMLIGGLNASNPASNFVVGHIYYNSCNVYKANKSLSYLEVVDNTVFEVNG